jgi:hypothetical protein
LPATFLQVLAMEVFFENKVEVYATVKMKENKKRI